MTLGFFHHEEKEEGENIIYNFCDKNFTLEGKGGLGSLKPSTYLF